MTVILDEHLEYFQLRGRVGLFRSALQSVIGDGDVVADLGCGLGVLGLEALQAGASRVYGIDHSDAIELARETVRRAGLADRYTAIRGSTYRTRLPEQVDVLLCDHVGCFGFDYGIIPMLDDARKRLLKPGGAVIPASMTLLAGAVQSDAARDKARAWGQDEIPEAFRWLDEHGVNSEHTLLFDREDVLGPLIQVANVDFTTSAPEVLQYEGEVAIARDGRFDGLLGCFSSQLAEGVAMTNSPLADDAIGRRQAFLPCRRSFPVSAGDKVGLALTIRVNPPLVSWKITPPAGQPTQAMSTWRSTILTQGDLARDTGQPMQRNALGEARLTLLQLADGTRSTRQIEAEMMAAHGHLFPSEAELHRFIRQELQGSCT